MPIESLPTTIVGLLAFIFMGSGYIIWRIQKQFLSYIQLKNGNLERATQLFVDTVEEQAVRHRDAMINQNERHAQMMDDIAARLESVAVKK